MNHYAVPPQYYPLARPSLFAKNLIKMGHDVTIIAASSVHNSELNLITGREPYRRETVDGIPYVFIKCTGYRGNGLKRVWNILEFALKLPGVFRKLERPDVIVATSFDPISCRRAIRYAARRGIPAVAEIADLWPETLVSITGISPRNPLVLALRRIEKTIYTQADAIVFTMEGAYDYIRERHWEKAVPESKVYYINNGIDLEQFRFNREHYHVEDEDLHDPDTFKVVYTGSIRKVNNVGRLLDAAKLVTNDRIRFLIWGDGNELEQLRARVRGEGISNVRFKGRVEKKYIPYILSCSDLNMMHGEGGEILRFGLSANKLFDYFAAGKPVVTDFPCRYNPAAVFHVGAELDDADPAAIAHAVDSFASMDKETLATYGKNAEKAAEQYDFKRLSEKLYYVFQKIDAD